MTDRVADRLYRMKLDAERNADVEFGGEAVTPSEFRKRFEAAPEHEKKRIVQTIGQERLLKMLRGKSDA